MQVNAPSRHTIVEDRLGQVEWRIDTGLVDYDEALADMTDRADGVRSGTAIERVWLLEHPPLYTAGTSARPQDMLDPRFPVYSAGRGGQYTYHGPGQRVVYLSLDLERRRRDIRCFVHGLEEWIIMALADLDISSRRADGRIGIWTDTPEGAEAKIGAIGIRVKRWVTLHGIAINVAPDLSHFGGIVPCGISEFGVTSLAALGVEDGSARLDAALLHRFPEFLQGLSLPQCGA